MAARSWSCVGQRSRRAGGSAQFVLHAGAYPAGDSAPGERSDRGKHSSTVLPSPALRTFGSRLQRLAGARARQGGAVRLDVRCLRDRGRRGEAVVRIRKAAGDGVAGHRDAGTQDAAMHRLRDRDHGSSSARRDGRAAARQCLLVGGRVPLDLIARLRRDLTVSVSRSSLPRTDTRVPGSSLS